MLESAYLKEKKIVFCDGSHKLEHVLISAAVIVKIVLILVFTPLIAFELIESLASKVHIKGIC